MPYIPVGKNLVDRVNISLKDAVKAGQLLTTNAQGSWQPLSAPITDVPFGVVDRVSEDGHTAVIRMTGSDLIYRTEPSHPTYTYTLRSSTDTTVPSRPILPTIDPAPANFDGTFHFEGNAPELIEQLHDMMAPGIRLVVNGDAIYHAQSPPRTVTYTYSADTSPPVKTKKTRKKQEKIKTIKDQMKDIP